MQTLEKVEYTMLDIVYINRTKLGNCRIDSVLSKKEDPTMKGSLA